MTSVFGITIHFLFLCILAYGDSEIKEVSSDLQRTPSWTKLGTFNNKTFYTDLSVGLQYLSNALDLCHWSGLNAAVMENSEENAYVALLLQNAVPDFQYFWIAATDLFHEGLWTSFKTGNTLSYTNWLNEGGNSILSNCIYFTKSGNWVHTSCSSDTNRPLCEESI